METSGFLGDPNDPCYEDDLIPIFDGGGSAQEHEKNCAELNKISNNTNYIAALEDLKNDKLQDNREHGYSFKTGPQGILPPVALPPGTQDTSTIGIPTGLSNFGGAHTHPDDGKTMPMFSPQDIIVLYELMKNYNYSGNATTPPTMLSTFVYTVTTINGTYALKIDSTIFYGLMEQYMATENSIEKFIKELANQQENKNVNDSPESFEKDFINFIKTKNLGISLYKASEDFSQWDRLAIDSADGNKIKSIKCI